MGGAVQPRVFEIEPHAFGHQAAHRFLRRDGEGAFRLHGGGQAGLTFLGRGQRLRQKGFVGAEDRGDNGRADPALIPVHQRIVRANAQCRGKGGRLFAHKPHDICQMRAHQREVGGAFGLAPDLLAMRIGAGAGFHQIGGDGGGARMGVAHQAKIGGRPGVLADGRLLGGGEVVRHGRRHHLGVGQAREHRELIGSRGGASGRHHGGGVPAKHRGAFVDRRDFGETFGQAPIGG